MLRSPARHTGGGLYEAVVTPEAAGTYRVWLLDEAAGPGPNTGSPLVLEVTTDEG
jgi:hypothetical protein